MKWSRTAVAVAVFALSVVAGCNNYNNTVQYNTGATITNISPSAIAATPTPPAGAPNCPNTPSGQTNPCFSLFVLGSLVNGFQPGTVVEWNNGKLPACTSSNGTANTSASRGCSTYIDSTDVTAYIPYSLVAKPGTAYVNTFTPQSGMGNNGLSNALTFTIYGSANPAPQFSSVSPNSTNYCAYSSPSTCANVSITITGSNFLPVSQNGGSSVTFTGLATYGVETAITITSMSSTQLKATIPGTYLCATDHATLNVINPPSAICIVNCPNLGGGNTKNSPNFQINGTAGANSCPPQSPPNPNPAVLAAEETPAVSQDGRYVVYATPQNEISQILLRDTCVGADSGCTASTQTVSVATDGAAGNADSHNPVMTSDGRFVAFSSAATNLVAGASPGRQVYLRDTCLGAASSCRPATSLVSTDPEGKLTGTEAILPSISSTGRFIAFLAVTPSHPSGSPGSKAATSATTPNSGLRQVFVRDTCLGATNCTPATTRISLSPGDAPAGSTRLVGPALAGRARQIALSDGKSATVFTPTVPIDDQVFLAIRDNTH